MFKCTDCGQEYEIKPDYCDCGNDIFEDISPAMPETTQEPIFTPRPQVTTKPIDLPFDLASIIIFSICIILSILSWTFIGRDSGKPETPVTSAKTAVVTNIPSIDQLWKDNPISPKPIEQTTAKTISVEPKKSTIFPIKKTEAKPATPTPAISTQPVVLQKTTPSMTEEQKQKIIKKLTTSKKTAPAPKVEVPTPAPPVVVQPEPPKIDYAAQKRELNAYKTALRNKLGGNINFAAVIGDGQCTITFKIDQSGNLTNRAFSVQAANDSLNDAVYAAMIQNPTFKAPPEGYNNETLTLSVKIYGGQFEVSLK